MITPKTPLLRRLSMHYAIIRGVEVGLIALAVGLLAGAMAGWIWRDASAQIGVALVAAVVAAFLVAWRRKVFMPATPILIHHLNNRYPELQASADLLLKEESALTIIQKIQVMRVQHQLQKIYPEIKLPHQLRNTSIVLLISIAISAVLMAFNSFSRQEAGQLVNQVQASHPVPAAARLESLIVTISPPAYTGLPSRKAEDANLAVQQNSIVTWHAEFSMPVTAWLVLSGRDSIELKEENGDYVLRKNIFETTFYQIAWRVGENTVYSDFFKVEVVKDEPVQIEINNLEQFTRLAQTDSWKVPVKATLRDDYGVTHAQIVATVSKGSGESVKFREEKLKFSSPQVISGKEVNAQLTMDLQTLGLEPGDELYFYVEALDNKQPEANYNRTETFFIAIQDTTRYQTVDEDGLGVDLMPEYFRSQRQIIIDTEKLLKEKRKISQHQFKSTSNELGYDQKVLRLRYGQFMGEEFEDQIGGGAISIDEHEDETAEEVAERFSHQHDTENEHNLVDQRKAPDSHSHDEDEDETDPLAAFAHQHDDGEVATFFIESMRTKLKAALTVMWDAELYLRLYEPEKSLPYQYTALKLLKEISNDSRIYVHRTGFDPPPLKEEKRLTADLSEINSSTTSVQAEKEGPNAAILQAQQELERLLESSTEPTVSQTEILRRAGTELAAVVLEQPGKYLEGLSLLKAVIENTLPPDEQRSALLTLRMIFWEIVRESPASPVQKVRATHPLTEQFLQNLVND